MIDVRLLRDPALASETRRRLARRGGSFEAIDRIAELDVERRASITRAEELKARRNAESKEIGKLKQSGAEPAAIEARMAAVREIGSEIEAIDRKAGAAEDEVRSLLLEIPNVPDDSIPDSENQEVRRVGETRTHEHQHWDIATRLRLCDFERGVKVAGPRFYVYTGLGAALERALITFMIDHAIAKGYLEVMPPFVVNRLSMTGTGQYPKFQEEYYECERDGLALIPTAEVPVTNLHRDEILEALPVRYCAWTPCFRREAGAAGKDTRGIVRVHQFNKIELVKFVHPDTSMDELESLTRDAEEVLERLEIPFHRVVLAANDLGFSSAKTYDLEVWMPAQNRYVECSSCSNFTDYQARRMQIRYRPDGAKGKPQLLHTLNGSGVAVGRVWASLVENNLEEDGSIRVPPVLRPYLGGRDRITAP